MITLPQRPYASTRGFTTLDPERQGVFAGMSGLAIKTTPALRTAPPQAQTGRVARSNSFARVSQAPK
jgi:hypothetical protein